MRTLSLALALSAFVGAPATALADREPSLPPIGTTQDWHYSGYGEDERYVVQLVWSDGRNLAIWAEGDALDDPSYRDSENAVFFVEYKAMLYYGCDEEVAEAEFRAQMADMDALWAEEPPFDIFGDSLGFLPDGLYRLSDGGPPEPVYRIGERGGGVLTIFNYAPAYRTLVAVEWDDGASTKMMADRQPSRDRSADAFVPAVCGASFPYLF